MERILYRTRYLCHCKTVLLIGRFLSLILLIS